MRPGSIRTVMTALFTVGLLASSPILSATTAGAQQLQVPTGTVAGRVVDQKDGQPLSDVVVQLVGTARTVQTGVDGRFRLPDVPAGTVTIFARRIGFQPKTVTGLYLDGGRTLEQPIALEEASLQLTAVVVSADKERGTVSAAIDAQRNAVGIVSAIGSEQISRSPDADASQAIQRLSGVTLADAKFVSVRGLDPRYTTASLNGARLASPEPERKVVPLDLFPAGLLQSVSATKTFAPDQPGDFSGASIDLRTRDFPAERQITYSLSVGANSAVTGKRINSAGGTFADRFAFGSGARSLPPAIAAAGRFDRSYSPEEYSSFVGTFRNVWSARQREAAPSVSAALTLGGSADLFGRQLGYVTALTYAYAHEVRAGEVRAFAVPTEDGGTASVDRFTGSTGREAVQWGGIANFSTLLGTRGRLALNNTFTRSADNEARNERGFDENAALPFELTRLRYVERAVLSSQLVGEHELVDGRRFDWSVSSTGVSRSEPDRSEVAYADDGSGEPFLFGGHEGAVRTFGRLTETNVSAAANYTARFGPASSLKVGTLARYTDRSSTVDSYAIIASLTREQRELTPEEIFDGRMAADGQDVFRVVSLSQAGSYTARDLVAGGYAMTELQLGERYRLIGGARFELQRLAVEAEPAFGAVERIEPTYADLLPSLALNVTLTPRQALRFSVSQTLARPEYREVVPIASRDVLGGEQFRGSTSLRRTLIRNADARWELYPAAGEVVSIAAFAKQFDGPIERVYRGTSGTRVTTYENARGAFNIGLELEARKGLGMIAGWLDPVTMFSNVTVMHSRVDLGGLGAGSVDDDRPMVGQAPYVINSGLTYARGGVSATALYNVIGRRIHAASLLPLPSVYEEKRHVADLSLRFPLGRTLSGKLDAKNLFDAPYEITQGSVQREFYRAGRGLSLGLSWSR